MSITCIVCGHINTGSNNYCTSCGAALEFEDTVSSSAYHLPAGTLLRQSHYRIEKVLGEGGFGITYQGIYLPNSAKVAIKELWPEKAARIGKTITWPPSIAPIDRQRQLHKFQLEASYLQKCPHPNIAQVYDWFEENNTAYLVMEFISGKSLYKILQQEGVLSEEKLKGYFIQVAEALKVVHSNQLLHRDIKPDNILIDHQDRAVLIDFGATKEFMAGQTREMSVTLSPGYAPLEQYSYRSKRWPATDIYALCASMYELLTGQLPAQATERAGSETLIPPRQLAAQITPQTEQVILTGMRMKVEERFQTAEELIDALKGKFVSPSQRKAWGLVKQGKLAEAVQAYQQCLTNQPNHGEAAVELALVQIHLNDAQAEVAAQTAIQLQPNDGRSYGVLGLVNCRKSNWSTAVKQLQKAADLAPQEVWIQANLAWAWGKLGNWQQAESAVSKALQIDSNCTFALGLQAWIYVNQQQWKRAIRTATQALFKSKQAQSRESQQLQQWIYPYLIIALEKAVVTRQSRDVERRIIEFTTQVPDSAVAWGLKGWKQAVQGLWPEALANFEQASQKADVPSWVSLNQGITQEHLQNSQGAIQTYQAYIQKFPSDAFALFRLGTLLGKVGQWAQARSYLEKAVQLKPDYAEAYHNLGWVLLNIRTVDGQVENFRPLLSAYRQASEFYLQQYQSELAGAIRQAFHIAGVEL
ncbi:MULTISPECIES: serine/threonine-protein kinase [unclassified Moorena]|uniref:serine/threonine-protein kinase n=2 Tax=Moorena TaxID=1155738 RepID=UPI0014013000|nr:MULTISPECIES: serine/threonine-protein kinase [unclassified Moorena]NEO14309.1 protein kinase [Moorena sp. SIO3E8]NEQ00806.1 protein kinase [Moorena sp. SIO3F7]